MVTVQGVNAAMQVFCDAADVSVVPAKTLKSKHWASVQSELQVQGGRPVYMSFALRTAGGDCSVADLPDGAAIQ